MCRVRAQVLLAEGALRTANRDAAEYLRRRQFLAQLGAHTVRHRLFGKVLGGHASARAHRTDLLARFHCNKNTLSW